MSHVTETIDGAGYDNTLSCGMRWRPVEDRLWQADPDPVRDHADEDTQ